MHSYSFLIPVLIKAVSCTFTDLNEVDLGLDLAGPAPDVSDLQKRASSLPFNQIVGFGDDYNDNAQGSYAHGMTGTPKFLWGWGTWTDGPVAISWLSAFSGLNITYDYSFGSSAGGQKVGSVCNMSAVDSSQLSTYAHMPDGTLVPDVLSQIANYTSNAKRVANAGNTLHVLWTGNNDMIASLAWKGRFTICADGKCTYTQTPFLTALQKCQRQALLNLINVGAKYILVPDIYPRQLAPWTTNYIVQNASYIDNFKSVIDKANANLNATVKSLNSQYKTQIVIFPANTLITNGYNNPPLAGIGAGAGGATAPGYVNTCVDGCTIQGAPKIKNWDLYWNDTIVNKKPDDFFWMTTVVVSGTVMKTLGNWMAYYVKSLPWS